jgi:hypothetical protein
VAIVTRGARLGLAVTATGLAAMVEVLAITRSS